MAGTATTEYVLLPSKGLRATGAASADTRAFLQSADSGGAGGMSLDGRDIPMRVVDSVSPDGAKLVELSPDAALAVRAARPDLRLVPVVYYTPAMLEPEQVEAGVGTAATRRAAASSDITLEIVSKKGGTPIANAFVVAFVNYKNRTGIQGVTGDDGKVSLALGKASIKLQRLYVYPFDAHWSLIKKNITVKTGTKVTLTPLDLGFKDGLRHFYGNPDLNAGKGVTVGVIDTGVTAHPDLVIAGGANTVPGENPKDFADNGRNHGTHVAGIIAARGTPPNGLRGVAPGVNLRAYRVFAKGQGSASSFAIAKAVDVAIADKCDLINMSLSTKTPDPVIAAAVEDARAAGVVCIAAAGNDDRSPVNYPAAEDLALAVSAIGRKKTFPSSAAANDEAAAPFGKDKNDFIALFSNVGPQIDLTGPGVGIMSTVPGSYAEISGTSMACPAVTGAAARALTPAILKMKRNAKRSEAIVKAALGSAKSLGFDPPFEGHGLPDPE